MLICRLDQNQCHSVILYLNNIAYIIIIECIPDPDFIIARIEYS